MGNKERVIDGERCCRDTSFSTKLRKMYVTEMLKYSDTKTTFKEWLENLG